MLIKIDMEKAYNHAWIHQVMVCVNLASFNVLVNGASVGAITPACSLCQRNLISPFLFIICAKIFSYMLLCSSSNGTLKGIKVSRNALEISHVLFADDMILFSCAPKKDARELLSCLEKYYLWFGQMVSAPKSSVYFSKNTLRIKAIATNKILGFHRIRETSKHLGLPLFHFQNKKAQWQHLIYRVQAKILG